MKKLLALMVAGLVPLAVAGCAAYPRIGGYQTSGLEWLLGFLIFMAYLVAIFTIAVLTFRKGRPVLGCLGFFFPFLWLIGAIMPSKPGSTAYINEGQYRSAQMDKYTR